MSPLRLTRQHKQWCQGWISGEGVQTYLGGSFSYFFQYFLKFPHKNEIIWSQREVRANPPEPPLNPPLGIVWICTLYMFHCTKISTGVNETGLLQVAIASTISFSSNHFLMR